MRTVLSDNPLAIYARKWRGLNREKIRRQGRARYAKRKQWYAAWSRARKYGLTLEGYQNLLSRQDNRCAICGGVFVDSRRTHVDHCHKTGRVRGLLCKPCNHAVGLFGENVSAMVNAIDYLCPAH